jgi:hypothetical protein
VAAATVVAFVGVATWGCGTKGDGAPHPRSARDYVPDGGWASYRPAGHDDEQARVSGGPLSDPIMPVVPGSSTVPATVH